MPRYIDLHVHTTYSDGRDDPGGILRLARELDLAAVAIADHDNFGAYLEACNLLREGDPELVPAVELSAGQDGEDIHILGYYFNPKADAFSRAIEGFREKRNQRGEKMLNKLKDLGIDIPLELVREIAGDSAIGRPHVADAMVRVKAVGRFEEAFNKYIGLDGPAYVPKANLTPREAIRLIHQAEGLAFLAHPGIANAAVHIDEFTEYGLDGIEVYHSFHNNSTRRRLTKIAEKKGLLKSGGSDYHGRDDRHGMIGSQPVPLEFLIAMKEKVKLKNRGPR
nr:PHP domain-containing protein [candidate division Zixibacteria bacterium]